MEQNELNKLNEAIADAKLKGDLTKELIFELIGKVLCGERMTLEEMIEYLSGKNDKKSSFELFPNDLDYSKLYLFLLNNTQLEELYDKLVNRGLTGDPTPDTVGHPFDFGKITRDGLSQEQIDKIVEEELAKQNRMTQKEIDELIAKLKEKGLLKLDNTKRETVSQGIKILEAMQKEGK